MVSPTISQAWKKAYQDAELGLVEFAQVAILVTVDRSFDQEVW